jgi:hypothetical protein
MRLEFRVLWFENQMGDVRAGITAMERELTKHGLKLIVDEEATASRLDVLARQQEMFHDYDLVVVDYDLGKGQPKGDEVARLVRKSFGFTDIIFYSGTPTDVLRDKVKQQAIDGVYCSGRTELRGKLIEHVGFVVERLSRLEAMRGLAVVSGGRGDDHMREIIRCAHALMDEAGQAALLAAIDNQVSGFANSSAKSYAKLIDLEARLTSRSVTSRILFQAVNDSVTKILRTHPHCEPELVIFRNYLKKVIEPRNNLGHNVEVREENGWVVRSKGGQEINKTAMVEFRKDLASHLENLIGLIEKLRLPGKQPAEHLAERLAE